MVPRSMGETKTTSRSIQGRLQARPEPADSEESDPDFINNAPFEYERKGRAGDRRRAGTGDKDGSQRPANGCETAIPKCPAIGRRRRQASQTSSSLLDSGTIRNAPESIVVNLFGPLLRNKIEDSESEENEYDVDIDDEEEELSDDDDFNKEKHPSPRQKAILQSSHRSTRATSGTDKCYHSPSAIVPGRSTSLQVFGSSDVTKASQKSEPPKFAVSAHVCSNSKQLEVDDNSVTESDSEQEDMFAPMNSRPTTKGTVSVNSETESDDDYDLDDVFTLEPRPAFPRDVSRPVVPLVLDAETNTKVPAPVNTFLRDYQRDGIRFFWDRYKEGRGGILGDDMGLGKTIQVISFLSAIMKKYGDKRDMNRRRKYVSRLQDSREWKEHKKLQPANTSWPTCLIIAPSTVAHNWQREFETWGYFEAGMYVGPPEDRRQALKDFSLGRLDVLITSFDTARGDIELLYDLPWSVIFVDEAHKLKNPVSKITLAFNKFKCKARFGLTGTAIQNTYEELWTILDWSNPGKLDTLKTWKNHVSKPLAIGQSAKASEDERTAAKSVAQTLVNRLLPLYFMRRTKDLIRLQLPQKVDEVVFCPLTPQQTLVYKRILAHREERIRINGAGPRVDTVPCNCGSGLTRTNCCHSMDAPHFFTYLTILLKISNHLALILPSPNDTEDQTKRNREISKIAFPDGAVPKYGSAILSPQFCGKWDALNLLLKEWQKGRSDKVLIFTKSVKLLDMLDYHLNCNSYSFCRLDGSTKQNERMPLIDKFNNNPEIFVFLISTLAGGTGLNLTSANKVVIFDPNWNPAHDLQAMDRAYRFGQTRDVHVYRLLGAGSIEELIYARQVYKQQMMKIGYEASHQTRYFEGVQGDTKRRGELFGAENLFKLHEDTLATKMTIERAHLAEFDWALANMDVNKKGKRKSLATEKEALEVEAKSQSPEDGDLRGLASLFLDDGLPSPQKNGGADEIHQILSAGCIKYTHQNDALLKPSRMEESLLESKSRKRKVREITREPGKGRPSQRLRTEPETVPEWPPRRAHHKVPPSPRSTLRSRQKALLETGRVSTVDDLPSYAAKFVNMSPEEQQRVIEELDQHTKK